MKKRILTSLLALCLAAAMLPTAALAEGSRDGLPSGNSLTADGGPPETLTDGETALREALNRAEDGAVITLDGDVVLTDTLYIRKTVTLDGQGHTLSCAAAISGSALVDISGDGVVLENVTVEAGTLARHGVQFYCAEGGTLRDVTVRGGSYTAVNLNGAADVVLEDCDLRSGGYTHLEYAMGKYVDSAGRIPSVTLRRVTFGPAGESGTPAMLWADGTTVANLKAALGGEAGDEEVLEAIRSRITNENPDPLTGYVMLGQGAESIRLLVVESTAGETEEPGEPEKPVEPEEPQEPEQPAPDEETGGSGGGSQSGGSGGGSSETVTHPDGSTTTTVTKPDGTTTATTTDPQGNKTQVVTKPDGSATTTVANQNGAASTTTVSADGRVEAQVQLPAAVVTEAQEKNEAVSLPMPQVPVTADKGAAPTVTVRLPSTSAKVEIPVENVTPGTVAILVKADGTEEVVRTSVPTEGGVALVVEDGATVKIVHNAAAFDDVAGDHWGAGAIDFATSRELFRGTSESTFSPENTMTRAMIVTVLARYAGADTESGGAWYESGAGWAVENGVSDGANLHSSVTREQLVTMLHRCAGEPEASGGTGGFSDSHQVSGYAAGAMAWALEQGLIEGMTDGTLQPRATATRAQVAAILARYAAYMA